LAKLVQKEKPRIKRGPIQTTNYLLLIYNDITQFGGPARTELDIIQYRIPVTVGKYHHQFNRIGADAPGFKFAVSTNTPMAAIHFFTFFIVSYFLNELFSQLIPLN
jgi:hypothetical protein